MDELLDILKYVLPSAITFMASFLVLKKFMENEQRRQIVEFKHSTNKETILLKLQAYERLSLLLERISPTSLIPRVHKNGMSARFMQTELILAIRQEFEHNLAQQLYVSNETWSLIKNAKEETIKIVNVAATKVDESCSGADLAKIIYEITMSLEKLPTEVALIMLKREFNQKFA